MQPWKTNYNPLANVDDGSCDVNPCDSSPCHQHARCGHTGPGTYICVCDEARGYYGDGFQCLQKILACTYTSALNYDSRCALAAGVCREDGSCTFAVAGCTVVGSDNYNPAAKLDDGSCYTYGCTFPTADNYNPVATTDCVSFADNGTCVARHDPCKLAGCSDPTADNYMARATTDDGTCTYTRFGCTYSNSVNFNPRANTDDGSCVSVVRGCTHPNATNFDSTANVDDDTCQWIPCEPFENNCHKNATCIHMGPQIHNCSCNLGYVGNGSACAPIIRGCMDAAALNFLPAANVAGVCVPMVLGCNETEALNFDPYANTNDGSCVKRVCGCTDSRALNFDIAANVDDGSCELDPCRGSDWNVCSSNASCFYQKRAHNRTKSIWQPAVAQCEQATLVESAVDRCTLLHSRLQRCQSVQLNGSSVSSSTSVWLRNDGSCVPKHFCTEDLQNPFPHFKCSVLGGRFSHFVPCGLHGCVPRRQCPQGAYQCTCRKGFVGDGFTCTAAFPGCTSLSAFNYNPQANVDDGNCAPVVKGCTNSMASNFDQLANVDNRSCVVHPCHSVNHNCSVNASCAITGPNKYACRCFPGYGGNGIHCIMVHGCTYPEAMNYQPSATMDDGSCVFYVYGCLNSSATNYAPAANVDDGTCSFSVRGCTYTQAWNFDTLATTDDGSCIMMPIFGCVDPTAFNYNPHANVNTTCIPKIYGCTNSSAYNYQNSLQPNTDDGSCNFDACKSGVHSCHVAATCHVTSELQWKCTCMAEYLGNGTWCERAMRGCIDPNAFNFNASSNVDDGSCIPTVLGCTDPSMFNYNSMSNTLPPISHPDACVPVVPGCISETAINFEPGANLNDSSCIDPARSTLRFYAGSHAHEIGWRLRSDEHDIEHVLPIGDLRGLEYASTYGGFGLQQSLMLPAGYWNFTALDAGGNGWPGSKLEIRHGNGSVLLSVLFGDRDDSRISFNDRISVGFEQTCKHHEHCANFSYCASNNRCKSCGRVADSPNCMLRNDQLPIPMVDSILNRSRRARKWPLRLSVCLVW